MLLYIGDYPILSEFVVVNKVCQNLSRLHL